MQTNHIYSNKPRRTALAKFLSRSPLAVKKKKIYLPKTIFFVRNCFVLVIFALHHVIRMAVTVFNIDPPFGRKFTKKDQKRQKEKWQFASSMLRASKCHVVSAYECLENCECRPPRNKYHQFIQDRYSKIFQKYFESCILPICLGSAILNYLILR